MDNQRALPDEIASVKETLGGKPFENIIDGQWVAAQSGREFEVNDPATDDVIARAASSEAADVDAAVKAARKAFDNGPWPKMRPSERGELLWKLADAVEKNARELAITETLDNGKPFTESLAIDVTAAVAEIRYMAGWANKIEGSTIPGSSPGEWLIYTVKQPIGVVGAIVPWNFPLMMAARKTGPALAAGCTVVLKPAEQTPLTALRLGELALEVGFPPGVINVVTGFGETAGAALAAHPDVDKITFTGSTEVGKLIVAASTNNLKKFSLELGGKSPFVVFPDADPEATSQGAASAVFFNAGQCCTAGTRLFVHETLRDQITERVSQIGRALKIGPGFQDDTQLGPLISKEHKARVTNMVEKGIAEGAKVALGGNGASQTGNFFEPTVLTETRPGMTVVDEEIFGPVLCVQSFSDAELDEVARQANATSYGLAASVWTKDLSIAHRMANRLNAGMVYVNLHNYAEPGMPFGGVKQSGWGREMCKETLDQYCETKSVTVALS